MPESRLVQHLLRSLLVSPPPSVDRMAFRRTFYLCTALVAFTLGLSVGITLPVYVFPDVQVRKINSSAPVVPKPHFNSVSFVVNRTLEKPKRSSSAVDGIYWGTKIEQGLPQGYGDKDAGKWQQFVQVTPVVKIEEGCGRMQNRLVTFEGGRKACARYRQNTDQIQGELFSFYLGRELGLSNLAPSAPAVVDTAGKVFSSVGAQVSLAQWSRGKPLVLTSFIEDLEPARIPPSLRNSTRHLHPPDASSLDPSLATELAQWSDLIIFDYLTANLDRIVNNLYNLQWNPGMMEAPAHNLARHRHSHLLVFLDNESGLLHGYRLLDKYESYHSVLLDALCVFRRSTVQAIERLRQNRNIGELLNNRLERISPNQVVPFLPDKSIKILNSRLDRVYDQITWCRKQYSDRFPDS